MISTRPLVLMVAAAALVAALAVWLLMGRGAPWAAPAPQTDAPAPGSGGGAAHRPVPPASSATSPSPIVARPFASGDATVSGRVVDAATREGIAGARLVLRDHAGEVASGAESVAGGSFFIEGLPAVGGARLFVKAAGFGPKVVRDVDVPHGASVDLGVVALDRGPPLSGRVVTALGAPIAGAWVELRDAPQDRPVRFYDLTALLREVLRVDDALDSVVTGDDGTFSFAAVAPGVVGVAAGKPNWQTRFSPPVAIVPGASPASVELRLSEAMVLQGVVRDASGRPVPGAAVAALEVDYAALVQPRSLKTTTDAAGRFSFSEFGPGGIGVIVTAPGFAPTSLGNLHAGGPAVEIVVEKAARVRGRVFDLATGKGLGGAVVTALCVDREVGFEETRSRPDGSYTMEHAPVGAGTVLYARLDGYVMAELARSRLAGEGPDDADVKLDLEAGGSIERDLPMTAGGSISGRVVDERTGEGIGGAEVVACHADVNFVAFADPVRATAAADGTFALPGIGAGVVLVRASAEGFVEMSESAGGEEDADWAKDAGFVSVPVNAGVPVSGVNVILSRGSALDVAVIDKEGKPVGGASVAWLAEDGDEDHLFGLPRRSRLVVADPAGRARLSGLPAGAVVVAARSRDGGARGHSVAPASRVADVVVTVVVAAAASVGGVLRDPEGKPVPGWRVAVDADDRTAKAFGAWNVAARSTVTDRSGTFLVGDLPPGSARLEVTPPRPDDAVDHDGGLVLDPSQGSLTLVAGERKALDVRLVRPRVVAGTVLDRSDRPLQGISLRLVADGSPQTESDPVTMTAENGEFVFRGVMPGHYRVEAVRSLPTGPEFRSVVVAAGTSDVRIRF
jgi:protocatechuate 3,4-dioxygenase beta subunit